MCNLLTFVIILKRAAIILHLATHLGISTTARLFAG